LNPGQLFKDGYNVTLAREGMTIIDLNDQTIIQVSKCGNTYPFDLLTMPASTTHHTYSTLTDEDHAKMLANPLIAQSAKMKVNSMRWHQHLGHLNTKAVMKLASDAATSVEIEDGTVYEADCLACIEGK
jgi:hypothetical protein